MSIEKEEEVLKLAKTLRHTSRTADTLLALDQRCRDLASELEIWIAGVPPGEQQSRGQYVKEMIIRARREPKVEPEKDDKTE